MPDSTKHAPVSLRLFLEEQREIFRFWFSFMLDFSKTSTLLSVPFGLFLLLSYFHTVGSPMLIPDTSTALTLILVVAAYVFISSMMLTILYAPILSCYVRWRTRYLIKTQPHILRSRIKWNISKCWRHWGIRKYENEFLVFHSASLSIIAAFAVTILLGLSAISFLALILVALLLGLTVSVLMYMHFGRLPNPCYSSSKLSRRFRKLVYRKIVVGGFIRSVAAGAWTFSLLEIFSVVWIKIFHLSPKASACWPFMFCLALMALYSVLTNARVRVFRLPAVILLTILALALYFPSFTGSLALRVLGIGGGIPISIAVKSELQNAPTITKVGCLIIRSGNELIMRTTAGPTPPTLDECRVHLFAGYENSKGSQIPTFKQVEVFPASQLIQINKLDTPK